MNTYFAAGALILSGAFLGLARAQADIPPQVEKYEIMVDGQSVPGFRVPFLHVLDKNLAFVKTVEEGGTENKKARFHFDVCKIDYRKFGDNFPNPNVDNFLNTAAICERINSTEFFEDDKVVKDYLGEVLRLETEVGIANALAQSRSETFKIALGKMMVTGFISMMFNVTSYALTVGRDDTIRYLAGNVSGWLGLGIGGGLAFFLPAYIYKHRLKRQSKEPLAITDSSLSERDPNVSFPITTEGVDINHLVDSVKKSIDRATRLAYKFGRVNNLTPEETTYTESVVHGTTAPAF